MSTPFSAVDTTTPPPDEVAVKAVIADLEAASKQYRKDKRTMQAGMFRDAAGMLEDTVKYWRYNVNQHKVPTSSPEIRAIFTKHGLADLFCDITTRQFVPQGRK